MKQLYVIAAAAVLFSLQTSAQFTQNFDAVNSLTSGCNLTVNSDQTTTVGEVINGTGSLYSNPPVNGSGTRDYLTPYLNVADPVDPSAATTAFTVSFSYKLNETLNGQAVRTIQVGLQGTSGYTNLATITMDKNNDPLTAVAFNQTFTVATGVYRLVLKMGGSQGNGTVRIIIDDLVASANPYYSVNGTCNAAPAITNDIYFTSNTTTATNFASVLSNDTDPNNESFSTPAVTTSSPDGTVVFNADGSFTFTPNAGFAGTSTSFSYTVYDNGYDPVSGTALVTIFFSAGSPLPVKLVNFSGSVISNKPVLNWTLANNEEGAKIEIEKSMDGKSFRTEAVIMPTIKQGSEKYEYKGANEISGTSCYRLKITNKNNSVCYSGIVRLSTGLMASATTSVFMMQNPVKNSLNFSYTSTTNTTSTVNAYDISGKKVFSQQLVSHKGVNTIAIDLANRIVSGTYILEISSGNERATTKFIKQ